MKPNLTSLISDLSDIAGTLNRESDSINELIEHFADTLRQLNIGLEVWCSKPIESILVKDNSNKPFLMLRWYLGFRRGVDGWHLYLRPVSTMNGEQEASPAATPLSMDDRLLRDSSRADRIAALRQFPELLTAMKAEVQRALQAIQDTKKFVGLA